MSKSSELSEKIGVIPDFFHDIFAYIVPGYAALMLIMVNGIILNVKAGFNYNSFGIKEISITLILAYILGRFFEQLGYLTLHKRNFPFIFGKAKNNPKWSLIFDDSDTSYTEAFKKNAKRKIADWLKRQNGEDLLKTCEAERRDDYFNLIQFYLRARSQLSQYMKRNKILPL